MKIISIYAKGHELLALSGIQEIEYTPEAFIQIILGTNGSGKSTLLRVLTALPPDPADYAKGGLQEVNIEHNKCRYKMVSDFSNKTEHYFYFNGVNLNQGKTITVQRELVEQHFGLTEELFSLMIGNTLFTTMPALKRRDWIIKLSGADMSYALGLHNRLKTAARDAQGFVKHFSKRIGEESVKIPSTEELNRMAEVEEKLESSLISLMYAKDPSAKDLKLVEQEITNLKQQMVKIADSINKTDVSFTEGFHGYNNIVRCKDEIKSQLSELNGVLNVYHEEYSKYADVISALESDDAIGVDELKIKLKGMEKEIFRMKESVPNAYHFLGFENMQSDSLLASLQSSSIMLFEILETLTDNSDGRFSSNSKAKVVNELTDIRDRLTTARKTNGSYKHLKEHFDDKTIECPKCKHNFLPNMRTLTHESIDAVLKETAQEMIQLEKQEVEKMTYLEEFAIFSASLNRMQSIFTASGDLSFIWNEFREQWKKTQSPRACETYLKTILNYARMANEGFKLLATFTAENVTYNALVCNNAENIKQVKETVDFISSKIVATQTSINAKQIELKLIDGYLTVCNRLEADNATLKEYYSKSWSLMEDYIVSSKNKIIEEAIKEKQISLAQIKNVLDSYKQTAAVLKEMEFRKTEAEADFEALTLLAKELSPNEGLIADHVNSFMAHFLDRMNGIISAIWTYDLIVLPCDLEKGELTYKFPFRVRTSKRAIKDISLGSSSQRDIFNFAFKIVTMTMLGLNDFPLYLDELAPTLDEQHRLNIIVFVKQFIELRNASQLFMISHYAALHGALSQAQFCVLDTSNIITLPDAYNSHVKIKRIAV